MFTNVNANNRTADGSRRVARMLLATLIAVVLTLALAGASLAKEAAVTASNTIGASTPVTMPQPLAGVSVQGLVGRVISTAMGFAGVIALIMFVYGGVTWMMAAGNEEKITSARKTVVWATLGLILLFSSYMIANLIINQLTEKTMN